VRLAGVRNPTAQRRRSPTIPKTWTPEDDGRFDAFHDRLTASSCSIWATKPSGESDASRRGRLEHGRAGRLVDLCRAFPGCDLRAQRYLDGCTSSAAALGLTDLRSSYIVDLAEARPRCWALFADLLKTSPGLDPLTALRLLLERLLQRY
jgi:hypothetical protein